MIISSSFKYKYLQETTDSQTRRPTDSLIESSTATYYGLAIDMGIRYIQILSMEIPIELNVSNFKERSQQNTENRFKPGSARQGIEWEKTVKKVDRGGNEKLR